MGNYYVNQENQLQLSFKNLKENKNIITLDAEQAVKNIHKMIKELVIMRPYDLEIKLYGVKKKDGSIEVKFEYVDHHPLSLGQAIQKHNKK